MKKIIVLSLIIIILTGVFWLPQKFFNKSKKASNVIKVGVTADYPPFVYLENHQVVGFDIDLIKEVAQRLNKKIEFIDMAFNVLITGIQQGKIDIIVGGLSPDPEREKQVFFTKPYLTDDPLVIITKVPQEAKTINDLTNKTVIVNEGYTADLYLSKINGPVLKRLPSVADAIMALNNNKAFAFVSALTTINPYLRQHNDKEQFNIHPIENCTEEYAIIVSKDQPALYKEIEGKLQTIINDGIIEKMKKKWKLYD